MLGVGRVAGTALVCSQQTLTYAGARAVVDTAAARAEALGVPTNIAVVDLAGGLLAFARLDGAPPSCGRWWTKRIGVRSRSPS